MDCFKKVYVISNGESVKIGMSANPKQRCKDLNVGSCLPLSLEYQTDICSNAWEVERVCHIELEHRKVSGEWFDIGVFSAVDVVKNIFGSMAILTESQDDKAANPDKFLSFIAGGVVTKSGMYKVTNLLARVNDYRASMGMGRKQLQSFFNTSLCRNAISQECIQDNKTLSCVKTSSRGIDGGTWVSEKLFSVFIRWASGCSGLSISDVKQLEQS